MSLYRWTGLSVVPNMAGRGWRMLVECLSAGRAYQLTRRWQTATGRYKSGSLWQQALMPVFASQFGMYLLVKWKALQEVIGARRWLCVYGLEAMRRR